MRLPFGIKSAAEIYRRAMDEMLEGIDHPFAIMNDILITGRDIAHREPTPQGLTLDSGSARQEVLVSLA